MIHLGTCTPLSTGPVPVTHRWEKCASIQHILNFTMINRETVRVEKGAGKIPLRSPIRSGEDGQGQQHTPTNQILRMTWIPKRLHMRLFRRIQHWLIINTDEGSRGVHRAQVQIWSGHTSVPWEINEYPSTIVNKDNRNQGQRRTI